MENQNNDLFDFSNIKIGDRVTRVYQNDPWDAEVIKVTDNEVKCGITVDTYRTMTFDRKTGISEHGKTFGFLINKPLEESHDFIEGLKLGFDINIEKLKKLMKSEGSDVDESNDLLAKYLKDQEEHG